SEVTSRRAIVRRISLIGSSRYADGPYTAPACALGIASALSFGLPTVGFGALAAASMSRLIIRPLGPLPCTEFKSTPASAAIRAAIGDTSTRPPAGRRPSVDGSGFGLGRA